jgi:hypothetical protein
MKIGSQHQGEQFRQYPKESNALEFFRVRPAMLVKTLYEQDFYAWSQIQVELLREGRLNELDIANLVEEIESLGRQQRQELTHRLGVLLGHLLKWRYQAEQRSKSWFYTIREQRRQVKRLLKHNPSLKAYLLEAINEGYEDGLDLIGKETPLNPDDLPQTCPFSELEILDQALEEIDG